MQLSIIWWNQCGPTHSKALASRGPNFSLRAYWSCENHIPRPSLVPVHLDSASVC